MFASRAADDKSIERDIQAQTGDATDRCETFRVRIIRGSSIDLNILFSPNGGRTGAAQEEEEAKRAVNVIVQADALRSGSKFLVTPHSIFDMSRRANPIGVNVLLREGLSVSIRLTASGPALNVFNSFTAFHGNLSLVDMLKEREDEKERSRRGPPRSSGLDLSKPLREDQLNYLRGELFMKQVETRPIYRSAADSQHLYSRKYRVNGVNGNSLDKFELVDRDTKASRMITVKDYYKLEHNVDLKYPQLPCIITGSSGKCKIPLEICHFVAGQRVTREMSGSETDRTLKIAVMEPREHFSHIYGHAKQLKDELLAPLKSFGLSMNTEPMRVEGRVLKPPALKGGQSRPISASNGQYDARWAKFVKPARIDRWALAFLGGNETEHFIRRNNGNFGELKFAELYHEAAQEKGLQLGKLSSKPFIVPADQNVKSTLKRLFSEWNSTMKKMDHVVFVLPDECPKWIYGYLQYLETAGPRSEGCESCTRVSCVDLSNYDRQIVNGRNPRMFVSNLLLKYNSKFGGINYALANNYDGYIFIGVDVCHPSQRDELNQSVAAAVGMWDVGNAGRGYRTCVRVQPKSRQNNSTVEDVTEIARMFEDLLEAYRRAKNGSLPARIVIFRDGVSEGQLAIVCEREIHQRLYPKLELMYGGGAKQNKLPEVACFVVQKRLNIRFMLEQALTTPKGQPDYNPPPGTVVDHTVSHRMNFDFHLAPHKAIKGTSKVVHYDVIHDTLGMSQDEAQAMAHALCYLSPLCTRPTSIPTPVNLADRAAERAKHLVIGWQEEHLVGADRSGAKGGAPRFAGSIDEEQLIRVNEYLQQIGDSNYRNTLFYV